MTKNDETPTHPKDWHFDPEEIVGDQSVMCFHCGLIIENPYEREDFLSIYGNITMGLSAGLIGNNIHHGKVVRVSFICKSPHCLMNLFKHIVEVAQQ